MKSQNSPNVDQLFSHKIHSLSPPLHVALQSAIPSLSLPHFHPRLPLLIEAVPIPLPHTPQTPRLHPLSQQDQRQVTPALLG